MLEFIFDTTRAVANLVISGTLEKYPHIRFILSHAGGTTPFVANKIVSGVVVASLTRQGQGIQPAPSSETMEPEMETTSNLKGIISYAGFSEEDREDIEGNNALKLFPRLQH